MKINGTKIKTPQTCEVSVMDIDKDSYRTASGKTIRKRVAVKRKLTCNWGAMSKSEMSTLLTSVSSVFFECTYLDPVTGTNQTKTFYVGDRTAPVYSLVNGLPTWSGLGMNFIER